MVSELERVMRRAYGDVADLAAKDGLDLRTAAFVLAIKRVARAAAARKNVSRFLPKSVLD